MAPSEEDSNNPPLPENDPSWTVVEHKRQKQMQQETRRGPGQAWVIKGAPQNPDLAAPASSDTPLPIPPPPRNQGRCRFFGRNSCNKGSECPFSHESHSEERSPGHPNPENEWGEDWVEDDQVEWDPDGSRVPSHWNPENEWGDGGADYVQAGW
eukprot:11562465-Heterocapsa_arctica.AAC.1